MFEHINSRGNKKNDDGLNEYEKNVYRTETVEEKKLLEDFTQRDVYLSQGLGTLHTLHKSFLLHSLTTSHSIPARCDIIFLKSFSRRGCERTLHIYLHVTFFLVLFWRAVCDWASCVISWTIFLDNFFGMIFLELSWWTFKEVVLSTKNLCVFSDGVLDACER